MNLNFSEDFNFGGVRGIQGVLQLKMIVRHGLFNILRWNFVHFNNLAFILKDYISICEKKKTSMEDKLLKVFF